MSKQTMSELESKYAKDTAVARIVHLERENAELKEALDLTIEDRDSYHEENAELRKENKKLSADLYTLACIIHEEFISCGNSFVSSDSYYWFHQAFDVEESGDSQFAEIMLNLIKKNDPSKKN